MGLEEGQWRRSSYSGGGNTECVEVAFAPGAVGVRDSKDAAPRLAFSPTAWHAFLGGVKER
ncbi:DUF397 domain-containing protein [Saccharothrix yanglingensis]|uniref:DUF397 domain-containing protein n=1 Tax=Saccharothrix yanglingensis TaxID=659496 RepID=A0ABU0WZP6_9PSEU|nr:DUF397 domain-containing protein [Saccharothrix yanglingensis]